MILKTNMLNYFKKLLKMGFYASRMLFFQIFISKSKFLSFLEVKIALFSISPSLMGVLMNISSIAHSRLIVPNNFNNILLFFE